MRVTRLGQVRGAEWLCFGRDDRKPDNIIDTNQYMVVTENHALLMDPGGIEVFASVLAAALNHAPVEKITHLFASHQDPDIISSLGLWDRTLDGARLYAPQLWEGFLRHFGCTGIDYHGIPDNGASLVLDQCELTFLPAHYLHSSANFHVYDPANRILMSGDVGAAVEGPGSPMFVDDFNEHIPRMKFFHQRWMPSARAKDDWIRRVRQLDIDIMAPQHGRLMRGDNVKRFLDWFERLEVGTAV